MSSIMGMVRGYEFGEVREMKAVGDMPPFRVGVRKVSERLFCMAAQLEKGQYLGFELAFGKEMTGSLRVFATAWADVKARDFNWIFEGCAEAGTETENSRVDLFEGGRYVYCLNFFTGEQAPEISVNAESVCRELLHMLEETGAVVRVIAEGGGFPEKGFIFISLPEKLSLRMKTVLAQCFPHTKAAVLRPETDVSTVSELPAKLMTEGAMDLVWLFTALRGYDAVEILPECEPEVIEELMLSARTYNALERAGVVFIDDLREMSDEELLALPHFNEKCLAEVRMKTGRSGTALSEAAESEETPGRSPMEMLDKLVGLKEVKAEVKRIEAFARMQKDMQERGMKTPEAVWHMEFVGNPGTAKTTVARVMAGIFKENGLLLSGDIVEAGRADLVGEYVGHTAKKVRRLFERAKGRLLFIDEAYSLCDDRTNSYGDEAISTLVQEMENRRGDTVVIFAGYPRQMEAFFKRNPGLRSRVPRTIRFQDYSEEEMLEIAERMAGEQNFSILPEAKEKAAAICREAIGLPDCGNGRFCRNMVQRAILRYAERVYGGGGTAGNGFALEAADFEMPGVLSGEGKVKLGFR